MRRTKQIQKRGRVRRILGGIVRYFIISVLALCIGISAYKVIAEKIGGNRFPMPFGVGAAVVLSGSMEPAISVDDLIIVKSRSSYEVNEIVAYQSENSCVVHRIIEINGDTFVTKGDANNAQDEPITISAIKGSVVCTIPKVGYFIRYMRTPIGILSLILVSLLYSELTYLYSKRRREKQIEALKEKIDTLKAH